MSLWNHLTGHVGNYFCSFYISADLAMQIFSTSLILIDLYFTFSYTSRFTSRSCKLSFSFNSRHIDNNYCDGDRLRNNFCESFFFFFFGGVGLRFIFVWTKLKIPLAARDLFFASAA